MKLARSFGLAWIFGLIACQPHPSLSVTILVDDRALRVDSGERIPQRIFAEAGIPASPHDRALVNGSLFPLDGTLPAMDHIQLQLRPAVPLTIISPNGQENLRSSALDVGMAVYEAGVPLTSADKLDPPASTPITGPMTITITPARELTIFIGEKILQVRSAAGTVGEVLAEVGFPLVGLDFSSPPEQDPPPPDGQIRVVKLKEEVKTTWEQISFATEVIESPDIPFGQQQTLQVGINGLAMVRTRVHYEDGKEVDRIVEDKVVVRDPQTRRLASGSQVVLTSGSGAGTPSDYWLALEMYATVYSPCQSGTGGCSYGTASGAPAGKGIVAVDYSIYSYLAGMRVFIPGYGVATIGDTGGGPIIETALGVPRTRWIDLGFDEGQIVDMTGWVTVYFLAPAPAEIPYFLK